MIKERKTAPKVPGSSSFTSVSDLATGAILPPLTTSVRLGLQHHLPPSFLQLCLLYAPNSLTNSLSKLPLFLKLFPLPFYLKLPGSAALKLNPLRIQRLNS